MARLPPHERSDRPHHTHHSVPILAGQIGDRSSFAPIPTCRQLTHLGLRRAGRPAALGRPQTERRVDLFDPLGVSRQLLFDSWECGWHAIHLTQDASQKGSNVRSLQLDGCEVGLQGVWRSLRQALRVIEHHADDYIAQARIAA